MEGAKQSMVKISVTDEDIKYGHRGCSGSCPVALALGRLFDHECAVTATNAYVSSKKARMPANASYWVVAFDRGEPVQPIEFDLEFH